MTVDWGFAQILLVPAVVACTASIVYGFIWLLRVVATAVGRMVGQ